MHTDINGRLPSTEDWRRTYTRATQRLAEASRALDQLSLRQAPRSLSGAHVRYMLAPGHIERLAKTAMSLSGALYNWDLMIRQYKADPDDLPDIEHARQHLRAASDSLHRIQRRHGGTR